MSQNGSVSVRQWKWLMSQNRSVSVWFDLILHRLRALLFMQSGLWTSDQRIVHGAIGYHQNVLFPEVMRVF